jgi:hypothetical protein
MFREALSVLRDATEPLTTRQLKRRGGPKATLKQFRDLESSLRASLANNEGKTVARVAEGIPARWRLKQQAMP